VSEKKDEPAFPQTIDDMGTMRSVTQGLSKREWFAGMALQGMLSANFHSGMVKHDAPLAAKQAYVFADAMLKEGQSK